MFRRKSYWERISMRIVEEWLNSSYNGERHARRLQMIDDIEKENL
ncbi:putative ribose-5-phosphate isomerase 1 [Clostridioides difficile DA00167]|nr:putative ribose-5-phosphate isomerase 1 [Clostridioides difficile DA00167]